MKKTLFTLFTLLICVSLCSCRFCGGKADNTETQSKLFYEKDGFTVYGKFGTPPENAFSVYTEKKETINEEIYSENNFYEAFDVISLSNRGFCCTAQIYSADESSVLPEELIGNFCLLFLDESLKPVNYAVLNDTAAGCENTLVQSGDYVFLYTEHVLTKYGLNGEKADFVPVVSNIEHRLFVSDKYIFLQSNNEITCYNSNLKEKFTFDTGLKDNLILNIFYKDGTVIVLSQNKTGEIPSPGYISAVYYKTQSILSAYKIDGTLLWRDVTE